MSCTCSKKNNKSVQPRSKSGTVILNSLRTNASDFSLVKNVYTSCDPRLINQVRNTRLPLDRPPFDTTVQKSDIHSSNFKTDGYENYKDISVGQITYYVDRSIEDTYNKPNFVNKETVTKKVYVDPMSGLNPQYVRETSYRNPYTQQNRYKYGLSFLEDTTAQREDIMSKQMGRQNREKWSAWV
jgi:hypothetical protein